MYGHMDGGRDQWLCSAERKYLWDVGRHLGEIICSAAYRREFHTDVDAYRHTICTLDQQRILPLVGYDAVSFLKQNQDRFMNDYAAHEYDALVCKLKELIATRQRQHNIYQYLSTAAANYARSDRVCTPLSSYCNSSWEVLARTD